MSWIWDKCVNRTVSPAVSGAVVSLMRRGNAGTADDEEAAVPQADADLVVTLRADPAGPAPITVSGELDYRAAGAGAVLALAGPLADTFRLLTLTGLDRLFPSYHTVGAAIDALAGPDRS